MAILGMFLEGLIMPYRPSGFLLRVLLPSSNRLNRRRISIFHVSYLTMHLLMERSTLQKASKTFPFLPFLIPVVNGLLAKYVLSIRDPATNVEHKEELDAFAEPSKDISVAA